MDDKGIAITAICVLMLVALFLGYDGVLLSATIGIISGLAGREVIQTAKDKIIPENKTKKK